MSQLEEMMEQNVESQKAIIVNRPRKHSWSRPVRTRNASVNIENLTPNIVDGTAHICFSKDKSWFQGNIIEYGKSEAQTGSIYKLSGKIINPVLDPFDEEKLINESDLFQLQTNWMPITEGDNEDGSSDFSNRARPISNPHLSKLSKSDGESSSNSPVSSVAQSSLGSGSDYLDSDLVTAAIERLNFEDSQSSPATSTRSSSFSVNSPASPSEFNSRPDQDPNCRKYNIALTEFETGMTYNMEGYYKENSSFEITIVGKEKYNQISFKSKKSFKGNSADIMISRHLGPNFVDNNMSVFVGDIRLRYTDPICRPSNKATPHQW